jgi:cytoskeleton protein RodZ
MKRFFAVASTDQDNSSVAASEAVNGVGAALRVAREKTGKDIAAVAEQLRIRKAFLLALEEGRHRDLPGGTYAVGFLRTYAEFLDLDGEEMVRRFKQEAASELHSRSELSFPLPTSEGCIPNGAILFLGMILAIVAYGGWYWLNTREPKVAEIVPPLPERLSSVLNRPASLTADKAAPAKPDEIPAAEPAKAVDAPAAAKPGHDKAKEDEVVPPAEEEEAAKGIAPAPAPVSTPAPVSAPVIVVPEPAKPVEKAKVVKAAEVKSNAPKPPQVKAPEVKPAEVKPAEVKPAEPVAEPKSPDAAPVAPKPVDGKALGGGDARVVIKAVSEDCWMQVREMDGKLLVSKLLRRGESFRIPNRPGLTLTVGNAGAVEVEVDGVKAGPLGQTGQVRHDINLDPAKLQAGG